MTGTRTHVAETLSFGIPRILRDSLRTLSSSDEYPSSLSEPAHGITFMASGPGNGPRSVITPRKSLATDPKFFPATLEI